MAWLPGCTKAEELGMPPYMQPGQMSMHSLGDGAGGEAVPAGCLLLLLPDLTVLLTLHLRAQDMLHLHGWPCMFAWLRLPTHPLQLTEQHIVHSELEPQAQTPPASASWASAWLAPQR